MLKMGSEVSAMSLKLLDPNGPGLSAIQAIVIVTVPWILCFVAAFGPCYKIRTYG